MVPYWERRFEPQSPGGRRATAWLNCFLAVVWIVLTLLRPQPFHAIEYFVLGACSLALILGIWGLVSMDEWGGTAIERLGERKLAGRALADWWTLVLSLALLAGCFLYFQGPWKWMLASAFALWALHLVWHLFRPPTQTKTLPPLTGASWPEPVEKPE